MIGDGHFFSTSVFRRTCTTLERKVIVILYSCSFQGGLEVRVGLGLGLALRLGVRKRERDENSVCVCVCPASSSAPPRGAVWVTLSTEGAKAIHWCFNRLTRADGARQPWLAVCLGEGKLKCQTVAVTAGCCVPCSATWHEGQSFGPIEGDAPASLLRHHLQRTRRGPRACGHRL